MNYYYYILFTCVQNVNQTRNRITRIHFRTSLSPCPAPDHFATSAPVSPLLGWLVCGCGWHPWLAAAASQLTAPLRRVLGLRDWHTCRHCHTRPHQGRGQAAPPPHVPSSCVTGWTIYVHKWLAEMYTTDHSKSVSIPTINSCFIDF